MDDITNTPASDPTLTEEDGKAFDALANEVFTDSESAEVVQKPITEKPGDSKEAPQADATKAGQQVDAAAVQAQQEAAAKTAAAEKAKAQQPAPDKELDAIQPHRSLSPKSLEGWNALKGLAKQRGEQLAAVRAELETIKPQLGKPDPQLQQKLTTLEQELNRYKAVYENERSPQFLEKYDTPIVKNETTAFDILKRNGLPQASLDAVKRTGIGSMPPETITKWVNALSGVNKEAADDLWNVYKENKKLVTERTQAIEQIRGRPDEFAKEVQTKQTQDFQAYTKQMADVVTTLTKDLPWARIQEIPANATAEQKAKIEEENNFYRESEARFQAAIYPKDAQTRAEVALAACLSFKLAKDYENVRQYALSLQTTNKALEERLSGITKAGITAKGGSQTIRPDGKKGPDTSAMSDEEAIDAGMEAALGR